MLSVFSIVCVVSEIRVLLLIFKQKPPRILRSSPCKSLQLSDEMIAITNDLGNVEVYCSACSSSYNSAVMESPSGNA
jgi:hypothetical protein